MYGHASAWPNLYTQKPTVSQPAATVGKTEAGGYIPKNNNIR